MIQGLQIQRNIIDDAANGIDEHYSDLGHIIKDTNNDLFKTRTNNLSLNSKFCLTNFRIKSIHTDIRGTIQDYNKKLGDHGARQVHIDQLSCIIPRHCGDHTNSK